jgi:FKBP-type peptidyl-prolyl cis-trans isomerase
MAMRWMTALLIGLFAVMAAAQEASVLKTPKDKRSYALGMDLGKQLKSNSIDVDADVFSKGLKDALAGGKTLLTDEEVRAAINELQAEMKQKAAEARKTSAGDNKKAGEAFLAENKKKEGVVTLPSGLQYKILKAGEGKKPALTDTVVCQYRGTLINGTEFDSSYARGTPATFPVNGVIKGWTEALQLMPVGSKWQLFIPSELAYGERGAGAQIGPNTTLIFEVELVSIQQK